MRHAWISILLMVGCGPSMQSQPAIHLSIAVARPAPNPIFDTEPAPLVIEPVQFRPIVQQPVQVAQHVFLAGCGDGAGCAEPAIQCSAPMRVPAGQSVTLTANGNRADLDYAWRVILAPHPAVYRFATQFDAQDVNAMSGMGASVPFVSPIVGSYTVEAQARDAQGRIARCETTVAVTSHGLRVELSWNTNQTDVDLHSVASSDPRWFTAADCYYANRRPDAQEFDDAHQRWLDTDDVDGEGPENIRVDAPASDRDYVFGVHYYSSHGQPDPTTAIVVIYCGEQRVARFERALVGGRGTPENDFWQVAAVRFQGDSCAVRPIEVVTRQNRVAAGTY